MKMEKVKKLIRNKLLPSDEGRCCESSGRAEALNNLRLRVNDCKVGSENPSHNENPRSVLK